MNLQGFWADLPSSSFGDLPADLVAVLPIGAIEQHGPHLPVSVDRDLIDEVIKRTFAHLEASQNVLVLPTLSIAKSGEHDLHAGTLSLKAETLLAVLGDIGASLARASVKRVVLFNGHGGNNAALEIAARTMRMDHNMIVAPCSWFGFADYEGLIKSEDLDVDLHAGDIETSAMLAARPELVDMNKAQDFRFSDQWQTESKFIGLTGQPVRPAWIIGDLNDWGVCGNAARATADRGEKLLESAAENFAKFLQEFSRFDGRKVSE